MLAFLTGTGVRDVYCMGGEQAWEHRRLYHQRCEAHSVLVNPFTSTLARSLSSLSKQLKQRCELMRQQNQVHKAHALLVKGSLVPLETCAATRWQLNPQLLKRGM